MTITTSDREAFIAMASQALKAVWGQAFVPQQSVIDRNAVPAGAGNRRFGVSQYDPFLVDESNTVVIDGDLTLDLGVPT